MAAASTENGNKVTIALDNNGSLTISCVSFIFKHFKDIVTFIANTFSLTLTTRVKGQHKSQVVSLAASENELVSIDEQGLLQCWIFTTAEPCPAYTLQIKHFVTCMVVYKSYIILGTMLGRILVIKDQKVISEIYAHAGQVSALSIRRNADIEPSVVCSVGEDGTYLTFTSSGIKFKGGFGKSFMTSKNTKYTKRNFLSIPASSMAQFKMQCSQA